MSITDRVFWLLIKNIGREVVYRFFSGEGREKIVRVKRIIRREEVGEREG